MHKHAIYKKEWLKLKWYLPALYAAAVFAAAHFWFHLSAAYSSIEPKSMMWYRFAQLEDKPYAYLSPFFLLAAAVIAFSQFLPEATQNRVRILTHLPVPLRTLVRHHLFAGIAGLISVNGLLTILLATIMSWYYPPEIVAITIHDCLYWLLPAIVIYLGLGSVIIERSLWRKWAKLIPALLLALIFFKARYDSGDLIVVFVALWLLLAVYDSFLSVKTLRLETRTYKGGAALLCFLILISGTLRYQQEFASAFQKYYLFYSPTLKTFIYQKNGTGHHFEYGTQELVFDRQHYEDNLPFVYWKNRDMEGRLPVEIDGSQYGKEEIKAARLSLQYQPQSLKSKEVKLFPLFNPQSNKGVIPFPEEILALADDGVILYNCETVAEIDELTAEVNGLLEKAGVEFPIKQMWGKTTNMKPFDWGYFIRDDNGSIFNLRRADDRLRVDKIERPENSAEIVYMRMSENRQKNFYGYAIDEESHVFLISYPDYRFIELKLKDFDYQEMSFHLLADPLHYLVRYDDTNTYRATLFDKQYNLLDTVAFD